MNNNQKRDLLVLDPAPTSKIMDQRKLSEFVTLRDRGRFFGYVWCVQPMAGNFLPASSPL